MLVIPAPGVAWRPAGVVPVWPRSRRPIRQRTPCHLSKPWPSP